MPPVKTAMFSELGRPRRTNIGSTLYDDFLQQLSGRRAIRVYEEMSKNDATIRSILFAIENTAREVEWTVEPASDNPVDVEVAEFVEECLHDMRTTFDEFLSGVFSMLVYGFSFFETVYKRRDDGKIGWMDHAFRAQNTLVEWVMDDVGKPIGFVQYVDNQRVEIPLEKGLLFRTQTIGRPEGESLLRGAYRAWFFKKRLEEQEAIGAERSMNGLPVIGIPLDNAVSGEGDDVYDWAVQTATRTKVDEQMGIVKPNVFDENGHPLVTVELMSATGTPPETNTMIQRYRNEMAGVALADFIMLGHSAVGSRALADPKIGMFHTAMGAWLDAIEETLNRDAVARLLALNAITTDPPRVKHGEIREPDLTLIGQFVKDTAQGGFAWTGFGEQADLEATNKLRAMLGMEPLDELPDEVMNEPPEGPEAQDVPF